MVDKICALQFEYLRGVVYYKIKCFYKSCCVLLLLCHIIVSFFYYIQYDILLYDIMANNLYQH